MNWDRIEGNWKDLKGQVKERWGEFTDDDVDRMEGKRDQLSGNIQSKYGKSKDDAEREIDEFANSLDEKANA